MHMDKAVKKLCHIQGNRSTIKEAKQRATMIHKTHKCAKTQLQE